MHVFVWLANAAIHRWSPTRMDGLTSRLAEACKTKGCWGSIGVIMSGKASRSGSRAGTRSGTRGALA